MHYRLGIDLGSTSIGLSVIGLRDDDTPYAVIKTGVRIFNSGRNPKTDASLAVKRREARQGRRRRDRFLSRQRRLTRLFVELGLFPEDESERKDLQTLNPYELRNNAVSQALPAYEIGRALFHLNQRRGFKSSRKNANQDDDSSILKSTITETEKRITEGGFKTLGQYLYNRLQNKLGTRACRQVDGKNKTAAYDLFTSRAMVEKEIDVIWAEQAKHDASFYTAEKLERIKSVLLFQRNLSKYKIEQSIGRCVFFNEEKRAPNALPSVQLQRIYQEVNNLRVDGEALSLEQRDLIVGELNKKAKLTFKQIRKLLKVGPTADFNLESDARDFLKGNATAVNLAKEGAFGDLWYSLSLETQDAIVERLLGDEDDVSLIQDLEKQLRVSPEQLEAVLNTALPSEYCSLSRKAIGMILPELQKAVIVYSTACAQAGLHHSDFRTGEIFEALPYYGEVLQHYCTNVVGTNVCEDEKRWGRIGNPTVHIGLNQLRKVVNEVIKQYGRPRQIVVELTRELKNGKGKKQEYIREQKKNTKANEKRNEEFAELFGNDKLSYDDIVRIKLWEEQGGTCPYTGQTISKEMVLSGADTQVDHILPLGRTLDDTLNNKVLCIAFANSNKGECTPYEYFGERGDVGIAYEDVLARAKSMFRFKNPSKYKRFTEEGSKEMLDADTGFLARALNDTAYYSKVARQYLEAICPGGTYATSGKLTGMLRRVWGLNNILSVDGEKNRDDHRHHAIDACVIGVTSRSLIARMSRLNANVRPENLYKALRELATPWATYADHVERAVLRTKVSHKKDHGHEGEFVDQTAYAPQVEAVAIRNKDGVEFKSLRDSSNYCVETFEREDGTLGLTVVSRYEAYQIIAKQGKSFFNQSKIACNGQKLVGRLRKSDVIYTKGQYCVITGICLKSNGYLHITPKTLNGQELTDTLINSLREDGLEKMRALQPIATKIF